MNSETPSWNSIVVGILCFGAFILLFLMLRGNFLQTSDEVIRLPVLVIIGVMALFATLALVAVTFSVAGLSDETQALGLPEGSVRAAIALSLIVIFAITSIYLYSSMKAVKPEVSGAAIDFAKQVFAVVGTLMTAVASFYFASRAGTTPTRQPSAAGPKLASITPTQASKATSQVVVSAKIVGTDLQLTKSVLLEMGSNNKVPGVDVTSNDQLVKCEFTIEPGHAPGKYDVVVTTTDGATATLPGAFEILASA